MNKNLKLTTEYSHISHCLDTIGNQLNQILKVGNDLVQNSSYTKAEIASLKILISDLQAIKGSLDSTTLLLQNTLIPNLEYSLTSKINYLEDNINNNLNTVELKTIECIKNEINNCETNLNKKLDSILSKLNK